MLVVWFYFCLPDPLFSDPYSTVLNDKNGNLIGAKISSDGQWRFPMIDSVPAHFENAIITFEDKRFHYHLGIDFVALFRALVQNIKAGIVESGASTLSMQVIRMSRKGKPRNVYQKIVEMIQATRLEFRYSKDEIMRMYASHAPFGGNVVGLEAASWRYFNKRPNQLSVAEAAMLAVLPNAPSLIHISKNRKRLLQKRNRLLSQMVDEEILLSKDLHLYQLEKIPPKPFPLPSSARHLLEFAHRNHPASIIASTVDSDIQNMINDVSNYHYQNNVQADIHNIGILVIDTKTGSVLGYLGNAPNTTQESAVDMVQASRSSGSVLKPLLYAYMIDEGKLMPSTLIRDVPTRIRGFNPKNYNRKYTGATPADDALAMSLNIPAVYNLQQYGVQPFINRLKDQGFTTMTKSADHYGLSLILGGGEVNLWELCGAYANMGRTLHQYTASDGKYSHKNHIPPSISIKKPNHFIYEKQPHLLSAGAIYKTFEAMQKVIRPDAEGEWEQFDSAQPIAWKTGTSYGHRDAWAIGVSPSYTIGVWVGNADGEGKNSLVGVKKAGPVLFDVYNRLPSESFFAEPIDDLVPTLACSKSGHLASSYCESVDTIFTVPQSQNSAVCPYHRIVHLDKNENQVTSECMSPDDMTHSKWFELPPTMAYYYRKNHPEYRSVPSFRNDCLREADESVISFIYPTEKSKIYLPTDIDGVKEKAVFKAAHRNPKSTLYWHINETYLGSTQEFHSLEITAATGTHTLTIVDQDGNKVSQQFDIIN